MVGMVGWGGRWIEMRVGGREGKEQRREETEREKSEGEEGDIKHEVRKNA